MTTRRRRLTRLLMGPARRAAEVRSRLGRAARRTTVEEMDGVPIIVLPDVFNPVVSRTGALLAREARGAVPPRPEGAPAMRVLDLGTGTGIAAVFTALRGADVVAVDLNPEAVRNAQLNAQLHHVEHRVEVRLGDLFDVVEGERFDLVLFDPPRYRGRPTTFLDLAWHGDTVLDRFAEGLEGVLAPGGEALVVASMDGDSGALPGLLEGRFYVAERVSEVVYYGVVEAVFRVSRPAPRSPPRGLD